jgi:hypothetical protein
MRTTITIDNDVLERARSLASRRRTPFRAVVNEALRAGLDQIEKPAKGHPYTTKARPMGLKAGRNIDNIQELLAQVEGEGAR